MEEKDYKNNWEIEAPNSSFGQSGILPTIISFQQPIRKLE
jgi:hypothetical protein